MDLVMKHVIEYFLYIKIIQINEKSSSWLPIDKRAHKNEMQSWDYTYISYEITHYNAGIVVTPKLL